MTLCLPTYKGKRYNSLNEIKDIITEEKGSLNLDNLEFDDTVKHYSLQDEVSSNLPLNIEDNTEFKSGNNLVTGILSELAPEYRGITKNELDSTLNNKIKKDIINYV